MLVADMDLDQQEKKLTSGVEKALEAWANADEDKKPMYREAWQTEVAMLQHFRNKHEPSGEHALAGLL